MEETRRHDNVSSWTEFWTRKRIVVEKQSKFKLSL